MARPIYDPYEDEWFPWENQDPTDGNQAPPYYGGGDLYYGSQPPPPNEETPLDTIDPAPGPTQPGPLPPGPTPQPTPNPDNPGPGGGDPRGFGGFDESRNAFDTGWQDVLNLIGPAPDFRPPEIPNIDPFTYDPWTPPSFDSIQNDPSYLGRKREGEQALMNSKAAQGLVRTGHALKDLLTYNQDFASREYDNIWNRGLGEYTTNRGNAFDNWKANTGTTLQRAGMEQDRAWNMFQPDMVEWQTRAGAGQRGGEFASNMFRNTQNDLFDRLRWLSEFELDAATR